MTISTETTIEGWNDIGDGGTEFLWPVKDD